MTSFIQCSPATRALALASLAAGGVTLGAVGIACGGAARTTASSAAPSAAPSASAAEVPIVLPAGATPSTGNPFEGATFYINPAYIAKVEAAAKQSPATAAQFRKVEAYPTAIWLDSIAAAKDVGRSLDAAAAQQKKTGKPVVAVFVVYDLPNRDCAAASSAGELAVESGGEARYKTEFIDVIAQAFQAHPTVRIVSVVEPDSLGNLATNLKLPTCKASDAAYRHSVEYAIRVLSMPNVSLYLDAAHAGWLGWPRNRETIARIFSEVLTAAGADRVRGFATDVSNYDVLTASPTKPSNGNPCVDEITYTQKLSDSLAKVGVTGKTFLIDTSRDGVALSTDNWCNIKGAGIGERPKASPAPGIDAYYWIKPPGDSDGTSDPAAPRFDKACALPSSAVGAPQAGVFFLPYFTELVANAKPAL